MQTTSRAAAAVALMVVLSSRQALAQSEAEDKATARALAQQGSDALEAKDYPKAEDAFRRADALYHAPTLTLGLARAQAAEGKFVEAWESYNRIVIEGVATTPVFARALDDAKREIGQVEGRRSRIVVTVTGASSPSVTLDGVALKNEALGVPVFVNPGSHTVQATAVGLPPATQTLVVAEGQSVPATLALQPAVAPSLPPPIVAPLPLPPSPIPEARPPNRVPAIVSFAVGGAGLIAGAVGGVLAIGKHGDLADECPGGKCDPSYQSEVDAYHAIGLVSTVGFIVAGVGAAAGATLWVLENKSARSPSSAWIAPYLGVGSAGAAGRF